MRVLKFGGTSVADADAIRRLVAIVAGRAGARTVIVSALAGVTDALLRVAALAVTSAAAAGAELETLLARHRAVAAEVRAPQTRQVLDAALEGILRGAHQTVNAIALAGEATPALTDKLLASGELWSSRLVAAFLDASGVSAQWVDARHVIRTDGNHRHASPDMTLTEKAVTRLVRPALALDRVVVMGGFIGSAPDGATTTLGRGGSDYSAAIVGASLLVDEIEIWTDVDGVLSADPRLVAGARVLPALSYEDAQTLALFGAKVLHPRTIEPAAEREIPVRVLNSRRPEEPGTLIDSVGDGEGSSAAVTSRGSISLVEMTAKRRMNGSFPALALQALADAHVSVVVGEVHRGRVTVAVDQSFDVDAFRDRVDTFAAVEVRGGLAAVCAVGERLANDPRLVSGAFAAFDDHRIHLVARPNGSSALAFIVDDRDAHAVVTRLHDRFTSALQAAAERVS